MFAICYSGTKEFKNARHLLEFAMTCTNDDRLDITFYQGDRGAMLDEIKEDMCESRCLVVYVQVTEAEVWTKELKIKALKKQ